MKKLLSLVLAAAMVLGLSAPRDSHIRPAPVNHVPVFWVMIRCGAF